MTFRPRSAPSANGFLREKTGRPTDEFQFLRIRVGIPPKSLLCSSLCQFFEPTDDVDQLVKTHVPAFAEAHLLVPLAARFVLMKHDHRVVGLPAAFLEREDGSERDIPAVHHLATLPNVCRPIPGLQYIGDDQLFILDELEEAADMRKFLTLG